MTFPERYLRAPLYVSPGTPVVEAARTMKEHNVGSLVVVDAGRVVGIVTDRDLALRSLRAGRPFDELAVDACMTSPAATVEAGSSMLEAARRMRRRGVRRLPIVDAEGALVGLVSADDLVAELARDLHWVAETVGRGIENEARFPPGTGSIFGKE